MNLKPITAAIILAAVTTQPAHATRRCYLAATFVVWARLFNTRTSPNAMASQRGIHRTTSLPALKKWIVAAAKHG